ncbi:MAG TPA: nucleoside recognition domain-containing protein [Anaeromyxobacteraceae bacterium]|nr:nucleoside recognition domain-containing protein [Anaeromyxobacteraceae bacterium]
MKGLLDVVSAWALPLLVAGIPAWALVRKVNVYTSFLEGAKEGFATGIRIVPPLVAILVALGMLRASGALDAFAGLVAPLASALGIPPSTVPLFAVRPLSGGAALGALGDVLARDGADSAAGRLASVIAGSNETTFYVLAVYMGAVGITRYRHALPAALVADLAGYAAALVAVKLAFG